MSSSASPAGVLQALSDDLAGAVERAGLSVVAIHARRRIPASGILWRPGVVAAAHHTIHREDGITVTLPDGSTVGATLAGRDPSTDLAVLRLDAERGTSATLAEGFEPRVGQLVLALGRPGESVTAALGILSAVGGEWRTWHGGRIDRALHLDLSIYDGFSGGPLVDPAGRVIGLNTSGLARGMPMSIPTSTVARVVEQLLSQGRVRRGYIGIGVQPVRIPGSLATELGVDRPVGLMVVSADEGGPAATAGVLLGDIVVSFDGTGVADPRELLSLLTEERVGKGITLRLVRAGKAKDVRVTVAERSSRGGA
jgi:S1-C subfamily serine protease